VRYLFVCYLAKKVAASKIKGTSGVLDSIIINPTNAQFHVFTHNTAPKSSILGAKYDDLISMLIQHRYAELQSSQNGI